jgi:hypothetical protein
MLLSAIKKNVASITVIFASLMSAQVWAESSVWKVTKGNDYIFIGGTVHILPPSEFPLPAEFEQAYKKSDAIVLEAKLPDPSDSSFQMKMMLTMAYSDGKTITEFISPKTQQQLSNYVTSLGADFAMFAGFKPGFLMTMLTMLEAQKSQLSGEGVDMFYSKKASTDNKAIEYFETADFQMNMIAQMGMGNEEKFVKSNLKQMQDFKSVFLGLLKAWRAGNTEQLNKLALEPMKEDPETVKLMLTDRNKNWIKDIDQMFTDNDKEFVLVGVAHLVGEDSVLDLLKAKGYQISKI